MLKDQLKKDLIDALKAKEEVRASTLRLLSAAIHNREIDIRSKGEGKEVSLADEDVLAVLKSEAKKRKESIDLYEKGDRKELAEQEKKELKIIESYLPAEMSDEELVRIAEAVLAEVKPAGPADFGKAMGAVMKKVEGRASGDRVKEVVQRKLQG